jgi:hypothetical protein
MRLRAAAVFRDELNSDRLEAARMAARVTMHATTVTAAYGY